MVLMQPTQVMKEVSLQIFKTPKKVLNCWLKLSIQLDTLVKQTLVLMLPLLSSMSQNQRSMTSTSSLLPTTAASKLLLINSQIYMLDFVIDTQLYQLKIHLTKTILKLTRKYKLDQVIKYKLSVMTSLSLTKRELALVSKKTYVMPCY